MVINSQTLRKNSTSAVPECTASCSKLGKESFSTAEEMPGPVFGNRIVDLELIVEAFSQLCCPKCFAEKSRTIRGFQIWIVLPFYTKM
ncbi:hypothetical protein TNCV_806471 [Trichonephila clavipes]|nr:hypothetical protein TNCV_806471 [Trichonephila clavipes]